MARSRNVPKVTLLVVWNLKELLATRVLSSDENEWEIAEALLETYPTSSHIDFYGKVNGLIRTARIDEVQDDS